MPNAIGITKLAPTLNGTERASLIIKDLHQRYRTKAGFLTEADKIALLHIRDYATKDDIDKYFRIYEHVPHVMRNLIDIHIEFLVLYQGLGELHYRLKLSEALHAVKRIVANRILGCLRTEDEYTKEKEDDLKEGFTTDGYRLIVAGEKGDPTYSEAPTKLKKLLEDVITFIESIQPIDSNGKDLLLVDKVSFKPDVAEAKELVAELKEDADEIFTLVCIAERMVQVLGFDPFDSSGQGRDYQPIFDDTIARIEQHNNVILNSRPRDEAKEIKVLVFDKKKERHYKSVDDIDNYIIPSPTVNAQLYADWEKKVFR